MLKCLIAFILGYILCKYMGNGFSVGGSRRSRRRKRAIKQENPSEENNCSGINSLDDYIEKIVNHKKGGFPSDFNIDNNGKVTGLCIDDTGSAANMRKNDCIYDWCSFTQSPPPPPPPSSNTKIPNGDLCFGNLNPQSTNHNQKGDQGFCKDDSYCLNILDIKGKPTLRDIHWDENLNKICGNNIRCKTNVYWAGETMGNISKDFDKTYKSINDLFRRGAQQPDVNDEILHDIYSNIQKIIDSTEQNIVNPNIINPDRSYIGICLPNEYKSK